MPITINSNYSNPQMGQIVSNLAAAIYGDPEARMKAGYYGAESANANANAAKSAAETTGINLKNTAAGNLPTITQAFVPLPGESTQQHFARVAPLIGQLLQAGGGNAAELAGGLNTGISSIFKQGDPNDMARGLIMDGKMPDQNFSPTTERADAVSARNAGYTRQQAYGVANIDQTGANSRNAADNQNKLTTLFSQPLNAAPGATVFLAQNDPRRTSIGKNGVVQGLPTVDTVRGEAGAKILNTPDGQMVPSNIATVFTGKGPNQTGKNVSGNALASAKAIALSSIAGLAGTSKAEKDENLAALREQVGEGKWSAAESAASSELARSGNVKRAGDAFSAALGIKPGTSFGKTGGFFGIGGHNALITPGNDAPPAAPAAPAAPIVTRDQIPPPEQRKPGSTWNTPKGQMTWTGQGWVPAGKTY